MKVHPFINAEEIDRLNTTLAKKISSDYQNILAEKESLLVVITLKGALLFGADLIRKLTVPIHVDFVRLASYGAGIKSSGEVRFLKDIESSPEGKHILVLDEIIDSGRTWDFLRKRLGAANPKSLKICALLSKPSRREIEVTIDYLGREVEDKFLVGYGLDFNEDYRNLKEISYLE
ncbi:MAG: hypoxanthine phosphoribosyltransferase [Deltaproteobacteria bacterium]|nr:hypoxanthine phosphoribosyltransferase [Deltaproteobacteria bacterium]